MSDETEDLCRFNVKAGVHVKCLKPAVGKVVIDVPPDSHHEIPACEEHMALMKLDEQHPPFSSS